MTEAAIDITMDAPETNVPPFQHAMEHSIVLQPEWPQPAKLSKRYSGIRFSPDVYRHLALVIAEAGLRSVDNDPEQLLRSTDSIEENVIGNRIIKILADIGFQHIMYELKRSGLGKTARRLQHLYTSEDYEKDETPLKLQSMVGFLNFVQEFEVQAHPVTGVFSSGTLCASWRIAPNKKLVIDVLDENTVHFALARPGRKEPEEKFKINGHGALAEVVQTLREQGVKEWLR